MSIATAAYRHFMGWWNPTAPNGMRHPDSLYLDDLIGKDAAGEGPFVSGWVFVGESDGVPFRNVEGTGKCAIVFYSYDSWGLPSQFQQNVSFPRLNVAIYADASRDARGNYVKHDAADRVRLVWEAVFDLFHDGANQIRKFGDQPIVSTLLGGGPTIMPIPGGDYAVMLQASFNVQI